MCSCPSRFLNDKAKCYHRLASTSLDETLQRGWHMFSRTWQARFSMSASLVASLRRLRMERTSPVLPNLASPDAVLSLRGRAPKDAAFAISGRLCRAARTCSIPSFCSAQEKSHTNAKHGQLMRRANLLQKATLHCFFQSSRFRRHSVKSPLATPRQLVNCNALDGVASSWIALALWPAYHTTATQFHVNLKGTKPYAHAHSRKNVPVQKNSPHMSRQAGRPPPPGY
jgi:hypothetical protein